MQNFAQKVENEILKYSNYINSDFFAAIKWK